MGFPRQGKDLGRYSVDTEDGISPRAARRGRACGWLARWLAGWLALTARALGRPGTGQLVQVPAAWGRPRGGVNPLGE